jgi:hypothetical protein
MGPASPGAPTPGEGQERGVKAAVAAQWADLVTFVGMIALLGHQAEANPLVRAAIVGGALGLVVAAKMAVLVVLVAWPRAVRRFGPSVGAAGFLVGAIGTTSNLAAVAR